MLTTPNYALRYPQPTDPADGPTHIGDLATDVDNVLKTQIWTPLNSRVAALEAVGPPAPDFTTQNGTVALNAPVNLPAATWTTLMSTPSLAAGKWLLLAQAQVYAIDNTNPGHTTCHIRDAASIWSDGGGYPDSRAGEMQVILHALVVLAAPTVERLEAYNGVGKSQISPVGPNAEGNLATRLTWIRLA
jgi:hypothetical protein